MSKNKNFGQVRVTYEELERFFKKLHMFPEDARLLNLDHHVKSRVIYFLLESKDFSSKVAEGAEARVYYPTVVEWK